MARVLGIWAVTLVLAALFTDLAYSADAERRLIELAPGRRSWMTQDEIQELSERAHKLGSCGGFFDVTDWPESRHEETRRWSTLELELPLKPRFPKEVGLLFSYLSEQRFEATIASLQSFHNRYYTTDNAVRSAHWIADQFKEASQGRADVSVELVYHPKWPQPSVIAKVVGTSNPLKEGIIMGAHEDSINRQVSAAERPTARSPGADDNASGTAATLEVFRALMQSGIKPKRDLYFMTYAAEEVGLLGSQAIAKDFRKRDINIVGVMNLDMILWRGKAGKIGVTISNVDDLLARFTEKLIDKYVGVKRGRRSCGYACSDHASWDRNGFPAVFLFETVGDISPWWHHPGDLLNDEQIASWGMHFVKAGGAFMVELGLAK